MRLHRLSLSALAMFGSLCLLSLAGCGARDVSRGLEAWNRANDPAHLRDQYETVLANLPLSGEVAEKPWTDTYWPDFKGGLANRWLTDRDGSTSWSYQTYDRTTVERMSSEQRARLSPAEKYDILAGRFGYPLVAMERERTDSRAPYWHGLCHGWAPASIAFREPLPTTLRSVDGIDISFGSSDVKALLTYAQQEDRTGVDGSMLADRCDDDISDDPAAGDKPECKDINAGSFHIVIANQLGLLKESFVADITRDEQVWNQPIVSFRSALLGESDQVYASAAPGTVKIATFETRLRYIREIGPSWEALPWSSSARQNADKVYRYTVELGSAGEIMGGEWLTEDRPDFFWIQTAPALEGRWAELSRLYEASIGGHGE